MSHIAQECLGPSGNPSMQQDITRIVRDVSRERLMSHKLNTLYKEPWSLRYTEQTLSPDSLGWLLFTLDNLLEFLECSYVCDK